LALLFSPLPIRAAMMTAPIDAVPADVHEFINQAIDGLVLAMFPHQPLAQGREVERRNCRSRRTDAVATKLVRIDETWATTNMTRRTGARRGGSVVNPP
jgi:hypothetical protein